MAAESRVIAALFVAKGGAYYGLEGVDPWDETRDARLYPGPHPVVAHPPCARWCRLAGLVEKLHGHRKGDDGGTFASALASVRKWGGVLEHPAWSAAWSAFGLPVPSRSGGWQKGFCGGWSCSVEQGRYGHAAKKATWLYAFGVEDLPRLRFGFRPDSNGGAMISDLPYRNRRAIISWCGNKTKANDKRRRLYPQEASATPTTFRDELISIARSARPSKNPKPIAPF